MAKKIPIISLLVVAVVSGILAVAGVVGKREPRGFPLSIQTVQNLDEGRISFEVRSDQIVVTVVDRHGDNHIHFLDHSGMSKKEADRALSQKRVELTNR